MTQVDLSAVQRRAERILAVEEIAPPGYTLASVDQSWGRARNLARQAVELVAECVVLREQVERLEIAYAVVDAERVAAVEALGRARDLAAEHVAKAVAT